MSYGYSVVPLVEPIGTNQIVVIVVVSLIIIANVGYVIFKILKDRRKKKYER